MPIEMTWHSVIARLHEGITERPKQSALMGCKIQHVIARLHEGITERPKQSALFRLLSYKPGQEQISQAMIQPR